MNNSHFEYILNQFINAVPGGFFLYRADEEETIIYANDAMLRIFNCASLDEFRTLTGNSFRGIVHPDDLEGVERSIQEQLTSNQYSMDHIEYRIIQKGGTIRWLKDYGRLIHNEVIGDFFCVFAYDFTEEKIRELEERNKELTTIHQEHLRTLEMIEGLSIDYESIFYADLDTNQIQAFRVSNRFKEQFPDGQQIHEFIGFDADYINKWVYPDDRKLLLGISTPEFIRDQLSKNKTFHINYRIFKDEGTAYIQLRIVRLGNDSHISQIAIGYRNIDDEIIQEMQQKQILTEALNNARLANTAKNLFLSNMSHDIRTPMNAIVGFTSLAKKHLHDIGKLSGYLDMISASGDQLLQLLNDVLEISKIKSEEISTEHNKCSLSAIVQEIQMSMLPQAAQKNITFSVNIANLNHDSVFADEHKLSMILFHLVDNAVKYTKINGSISITVIEQQAAKDTHAVYRFEVEDTGIGISSEFLSHLFEPFEREKNTTLSGIHGTGLGLAITKELVELIGGTINVSSVSGQGSKFTVTLPLLIQHQEPAPNPEETDELPAPDPCSSRILIVDDNEINLEIEYEVLKDAGYLVDTAADGSIAVEKVMQSTPGYYDLILMDIQMPIMDGYHATRTIRKMENPVLAGIPIIAVSANTFEEDKRAAIESGMNAHMGKPIDTQKLYQLIRTFLKNNRHTNNGTDTV